MGTAIKTLFDAFAGSRKIRPVWNLFYRLVNPLTKASLLASNPALYLAYARHFKPGDFWTAPGPDTQLLIEGAGCCATHSFTAYVRQFNPGLRIAHTCEVPATVKYCVRRGIPVIVLTRNMVEFVRSATERFPQISTANARRIYVHFHRHVLPLRDRIVVADFLEVTAHPRAVVEACNRLYGLNLNPGDDQLPRIRTTQEVTAQEAARKSK